MRGTGRTVRSARWERRMQKAVTDQRIFPYIVLTTAGLGLLAGFVVTLVDREDFPTFGTGVWWAIVTLGTVGYGDVVPHTAWGRVVGSVVILVGVSFISVLVAIVTSYFVSAEQEERAATEREQRDVEVTQTLEALHRIEQRLDAIEGRLSS